MELIFILVALVIGIILGFITAYFLGIIRIKTAKELADELLQESEAQRKENFDAVVENIRGIFGNLSLEALSKSTEEFMKLAKQKLETER